MYNEMVKERFIEKKRQETSSTGIDFIKRQFNFSEDLEEEKNKDLCNFTKEEIIDCYKALNTSMVSELQRTHSYFREYANWCGQNNLLLDGQNHFLEISSQEVVKCKNFFSLSKQLVDENEVRYWISLFINPMEKFMILGTFEFGKSTNHENLANARLRDLQEDGLHLYDGRVVQISKLLQGIMKEAAAADIFIRSKGSRYKLEGGDKIIKPLPMYVNNKTPYAEGRWIYTKMNKLLEVIGVKEWMTINSLANSGMICFIKKKAKERGLKVEDYLKTEICRREVQMQYGVPVIINKLMNQYGEFLKE